MGREQAIAAGSLALSTGARGRALERVQRVRRSRAGSAARQRDRRRALVARAAELPVGCVRLIDQNTQLSALE